MYISGYNRTLALLFHMGVAQTLGHESHPVQGPYGPLDWVRPSCPWVSAHPSEKVGQGSLNQEVGSVLKIYDPALLFNY